MPGTVEMLSYALLFTLPIILRKWILSPPALGFPSGSVLKKKKNPPANAGDRGSIPDLGRSHTPWSN